MDNRKTKIIIIAVLCSIVGILSIGYATLSARLKISGTATVPGGKCDAAFVETEKSVQTNGSAECSFGTISKTSITDLKATFTKPGDSCTFTIPAKNDGSLVNYLADVINKNATLTFTGDGESKNEDEALLKDYVTYEVKYGETKIDEATDFSSITPLKAGETNNVTLKITFSYEATQIPKNAVTITGLDRTFVYNCGRINSEGDFSPQCEDGKVLTPTPVSTPNAPVLDSNMIPVYYDATGDTTGVWKKADENNTNNEWYDYSKQKWANAVTVSSANRETYKAAESGYVIKDEDINTMWVWIPRYSYTIKSEDGGKNYYGKRVTCEDSPSQILPGEIDVKFVDKGTTEDGDAQYTGDTATNWKTNEAFNFGGSTYDGLWVGKFETTGSLSKNGQACTDATCDVSNVTIKPGEVSLRNQTVSSFFYASRSMQKEGNPYGFSSSHGDLHMMKNDEWGAVSYLSQSKYGKYGNSDYIGANREVYQNKSDEYVTGSSSGTPSQSNTVSSQYAYNNLTNLDNGKGFAGPGASTTGTIYGVYDMSGGAYEYVMGVLEYEAQEVLPNSGTIVTGLSGFKGVSVSGNETGSVALPNSKYYNSYKSANPTSGIWLSAKTETACNGKVCYGHSLSETYNWYNDLAMFICREGSWIGRSGNGISTSNSGVFFSYYYNGIASNYHSCRLTLVP